MKHLTEEEWIEFYYGESADSQALQEHLAECKECATMGQELARDLPKLQGMLLAADEPQRDAEYGAAVWQVVRSSITPYPQTKTARQRWGWPGGWGLKLALAGCVAALAAVILMAFYSGRWWEQRREPQVASMANGQAGQRVILLVISDHLDRSQRLLAELNDPDEAAADHGLQATARELLTENRLYRTSAERADSAAKDAHAEGAHAENDASLETMLDDLEPVLVELANQPNHLNRAEIIRLRKEMNTSGVLFEIRVLRSKVPEPETNASFASMKGTA
jgi:hypothetical protein